MNEQPPQQKEEAQQTPPPTAALLTGAAGAFGAGLLGNVPTAPKQVAPVKYIPPKMTPAEYAIAKKEASLYAFKTLGYGTLLAFTGAGLLATAVGLWLDVRNFKEFSDKLKIIVPKKTSSLRQMLGGSKLEMTQEEQQELDNIQMDE
ncbi:unnamed protein product [Mucor hiemalis]